ncbi:selenocysteine-specific translation elongation factor [Nitratifractor salsuginis]|uniref:Selenocysteine-specific elongation factor n=1 Tax=Nitratifractor salsuginis (strain DSM 16511 / JCM 12458 / E9I37-1) TaxID=749222 RepID=E6X1T1_NITSE|nr:selenocysteine-specific translation elongation factor [Nitratifractor salsuginis]ADV47072.1 selenocysteine-specific translation elongation factor SelB [Nitratifractor salsuginis DSM 16511]
MKELIVGTAGHVDHGKTALIEAMTGYNGDELAEERERGITIDLSFSNMRREGVNVAFIDVPGHESLIKNMVSGAFGFDAALLVVAADEGIMPQTREHLAVLDLLRVGRLVVGLSKSDRVSPDLLREREAEVREYLAKAHPDLEIIAVLPTSIHDQESIERLKELLFALPARQAPDAPFFRYYIDRVFSPRGVGTVVTGTVLSGRVAVGSKVLVAELNKAATVRRIQVHGEDREEAHTHQRAALQLDIPHTRLRKGYLLASRGYFRGFDRIDVSVRQLGDDPLPHGSEILFISGAKRVGGKILYYADERYAALHLNEKVFTRFGDPYLLLASGRVAAGGEVLIPISEPIRKNRKLPLLKALEARDFPTAFSLLLANHRRGFGLISSAQRFALNHEEALEIARGIEGAFLDEADLVLYPAEALGEVENAVRRIYETNPRALLAPASVTLRIKWASAALVEQVMKRLVAEGFLKEAQGVYLRSGLDPAELLDTLPERIYRILEEEGMTPEAPYDLYDRLDLDRKKGDAALKSLTKAKKVVRLAHNLFVTSESLRQTLALMREIMVKHGFIDIRTFKAETGMSRKYCIAYLEYLDKSGDVVREGEKRLLKFE